MKLEKQFPSVEQSKKLALLLQTGQWKNVDFSMYWQKTEANDYHLTTHPGSSAYPVDTVPTFTISEFGKMIGKGTKAAELHWQWLLDCVNSGLSGTVCYNAVSLAGHIITQLENGSLSAEDCNSRLAE